MPTSADTPITGEETASRQLTFSDADVADTREAHAEAGELEWMLDGIDDPDDAECTLDEAYQRARRVVVLLSRIRRRHAKRREARERRGSVLEG